MTRDRGSKLIVALMLGAFTVLLVLNLVKGEPEAQAEPQAEGGSGGCCLNGQCFGVSFPADCTAFGGTFLGVGVMCGTIAASGLCPPLPTVVAGAVNSERISGNEFGERVWRIWSDGMVDVSVRVFVADGSCDVDAATVCGPVEVIPGMR